MTILQVQLANTFNEFRSTFNDAANAINYFDTTLLTGTITANTSATISGTTDSSSTTTGSLKTAGGLGVVKSVYIGQSADIAANVNIQGTTQSTSATTGSLKTAGGAGIAKNLYVGGVLDVLDVTQSTSPTTGSLMTDGGAGIAKNLYVGGDMQVTGNVTILGTNTSISTTHINVEDNMLQIANNNTANTLDLGFFGQYSDGAANLHSGFFRDASDGFWKLFKGYNVEPSTTISLTANGYLYANLAVDTISAQTALVLGTTTYTTQTIATPGKAIAMAIVFGG
jgi:hypothetical protein